MWAGRKGSNLKEKCCRLELYITDQWLIFSWFQCPCCSGQAPSSPGLPSGWLRERQDDSPSHWSQGAWEETVTSCWERNLLLGYVASCLPSITAFAQTERQWKGLYIQAISCWWGRAVDAFWEERKWGKYHAENLHSGKWWEGSYVWTKHTQECAVTCKDMLSKCKLNNFF